jgi:bacterioferritin
MKGSQKVLDHLQSLLNCELAARHQYLGHARKLRDWGLHKLADHMDHELQEEAEHADKLIERMLFWRPSRTTTRWTRSTSATTSSRC